MLDLIKNLYILGLPFFFVYFLKIELTLIDENEFHGTMSPIESVGVILATTIAYPIFIIRLAWKKGSQE